MHFLTIVVLVASATGAAAAPKGSRPGTGSKPLLLQADMRMICSGYAGAIFADVNGVIAASRSIQACLNETPSPWIVPPGRYRLDEAVAFHRPLHVVAKDVTWFADDDMRGMDRAHGMVYAGYKSGIEIRGLTLDGNGYARRRNAWYCNGTPTAANGANIHLDHIDDAVIEDVTVVNAVCGSGMNFLGNNARIVRSSFRDNGTQAQLYMWADGLTLLECARCFVADNEFVNNSDVSFIFGGGQGTLIRNNRIVQTVPVFAAFMLDNFNDTRSGDFRGSSIEGNTIDCAVLQCDFGISIGPHTWYLSSHIRGGTVTGNSVRGAKIGIIAQGAGTREDPVEVHRNPVASLLADGTRIGYLCGERQAYARMMSPDSHLVVHGEPWSVGFHGICP